MFSILYTFLYTDHPDIPQRTGKVNDVDKFDTLFFGVHFKQAHTMDPMCRMLLEHAYEAVIDAGINPKQLRGSRTGVFMGACFSESEKTWFYEKLQVNFEVLNTEYMLVLILIRFTSVMMYGNSYEKNVQVLNVNAQH